MIIVHLPTIFSILHLKIRSIKKSFEKFKLFLKSNFTVSVICFSETWLDDLGVTRDSVYQLPNYTCNHQTRSGRKGGGISVYVHKTFDLKTRPDLNVNYKDVEAITVEIVSNKRRNTLINILYRPP